MNESWDLLAAGLLGLAAASIPIGLTSRVNRRQRRAALAATFLAEFDRLSRATMNTRAAIENDAIKLDPQNLSYDHILPGLHQAAYELALISKPLIRGIIFDLQEVADQLVFSSVPGLVSEKERRDLKARLTDRKIELLAALK